MSLKRGLSLLALLVMMIVMPGMALAYEFEYFHNCPTCGFRGNILDGEEPTCTHSGFAKYRCLNCGSYDIKLKALGHDWREWRTVRHKTCTTDGLRRRAAAERRRKRSSVPATTGADGRC